MNKKFEMPKIEVPPTRWLFDLTDMPSEEELIKLYSRSPNLLASLLRRRENLLKGAQQ